MSHHVDNGARDEFRRRIERLRSDGLYRQLKTIESEQGPEVVVDGRHLVLMCSNNYLGLANHPDLARVASEAAVRYGTGAGASRLVSGAMEVHRRLEKKLADFKRAESCLLFNSGYHANLGAIQALAGKDDVIYSDALNHASIIDGARLSRATVRVYPHLNVEALGNMMSSETVAGKKIVVTDGVFSMDGDLAPIDELVALKRRHDALLIVDEAHATGVIGPRGEGLVASAGHEDDVDVVVGTLGKALGGFGAFAAGKREIIDWLLNTARSFIYTTALPPAVAAAALAAVELLEGNPELVERLRDNARYFRNGLRGLGLSVEDGDIPIIPVIVGESTRAMEFAEWLYDSGVFCQAIRPPSVPMGSSRLRFTVMATHTRKHLDEALDAVAENATKTRLTG